MAFFPQQKSLTIGGYTFSNTELSSLLILYAYTGTSGRVSTPRQAFQSSGYLTSGSGFKVYAIVSLSDVTTNGTQPLYGNTDVGMNSVSAPTSAVYWDGTNDSLRVSVTNPACPMSIAYLGDTVPASKYLAMGALGNAVTSIVYGVPQ